MYDKHTLTDNRVIERESITRHYYLTPKNFEIDEHWHVKPDDRQRNFIFVNDNGTDAYYLLNKYKPAIDDVATRVLTSYKAPSCCFDIVFISNGEELAEAHYERLMSLNLPNRIIRVKDVKGRNNAYKEAARQSNTRYFFAVFAKIEIDPNFDFSFGVEDFDFNHYVFCIDNPVNGLNYGHQALILYNKDQVLCNPGTELDFTMAQSYRSLLINCGVARYNTSPVATWRTSFRESLKLLEWGGELNRRRLNTWLTGEGEFAQYSIRGAQDAIAFHLQFRNDPDMLRKSYDWEWLDQYFTQK